MRDCNHANLRVEVAVSPEDLQIYGHISRVVCALPDWDLSSVAPPGPNSDDANPYHAFCHLLAYCMAEELRDLDFPVEMRSGAFGSSTGVGNANHSWLILPKQSIVDIHPEGIGVYGPPAMQTPLIVPSRSPLHACYKEDSEACARMKTLLQTSVCHRTAVTIVREAFRSHLQHLRAA